MKRELALRYAKMIHDRLHSINGILATPLCDREAVRIWRAWIFGSTVKGSVQPNDLDVLIECAGVGRHRTWRQGALDKQWKRTAGLLFARDAEREAFKWLTRGMKKVSRHHFSIDKNIAYPRVLIYPRFDLLESGGFRRVEERPAQIPPEDITIDEVLERHKRRRLGKDASNCL